MQAVRCSGSPLCTKRSCLYELQPEGLEIMLACDVLEAINDAQQEATTCARRLGNE